MTHQLSLNDPMVTLDTVVAQARRGQMVSLFEHGQPLAQVVPFRSPWSGAGVLAQHVQAVRDLAAPILAQLDPDIPSIAPFLQALTHLESLVNADTPIVPDHHADSHMHASTTAPAPSSVPPSILTEHQHLQQALTDVPTGICILAGAEQRYTFTNLVYERIVGRTDMVGKTVRALFPELAGQGIYELLDQVYRTSVPVMLPEIMIQVDRQGTGRVEDVYYALTYKPLLAADGTTTGVVAYVHDISDRRALDVERARVLHLTQAAHQATDAERQRLLDVLLQAPAGICVLEGPEHVFTFTNPRYDLLIGHRDLLGRPVRVALPDIDGQGFFELLDSVYTTGVPFHGTATPLTVQRDGRIDTIVVTFVYAPLRASDGTVSGIFVHVVEVTELVTARQAAEEAVIIRDQFFAIAAHELRTPLTTLLGYVQVLQRRLRQAASLDARVDHILTVLSAQGQRLSRLISTLMDVSRINMGHLSLDRVTLDLAQLTQRVVEEIRLLSDRREIILILPTDPCLIDGDSLRLEQVIINLLQNALKYSPDGGAVTVTVTCDPGQAWVQIADHGIGIPAADLPYLFTRFYRGHGDQTHTIPGMGLGLAVVHDIMTLHGGTITVDSTEGAGSSFTIGLPRDAG